MGNQPLKPLKPAKTWETIERRLNAPLCGVCKRNSDPLDWGDNPQMVWQPAIAQYSVKGYAHRDDGKGHPLNIKLCPCHYNWAEHDDIGVFEYYETKEIDLDINLDPRVWYMPEHIERLNQLSRGQKYTLDEAFKLLDF